MQKHSKDSNFGARNEKNEHLVVKLNRITPLLIGFVQRWFSIDFSNVEWRWKWRKKQKGMFLGWHPKYKMINYSWWEQSSMKMLGDCGIYVRQEVSPSKKKTFTDWPNLQRCTMHTGIPLSWLRQPGTLYSPGCFYRKLPTYWNPISTPSQLLVIEMETTNW